MAVATQLGVVASDRARLTTWMRGDHAAKSGRAGADRPAQCRGLERRGDCRTARGRAADGLQVAPAVRPARPRRPPRSTAAGSAPAPVARAGAGHLALDGRTDSA